MELDGYLCLPGGHHRVGRESVFPTASRPARAGTACRSDGGIAPEVRAMSKWVKAGAATAAALVSSGVLALFSPDLQNMLSRWEGDEQNVVYADKLADGLPTVCRGLTRHTV